MPNGSSEILLKPTIFKCCCCCCFWLLVVSCWLLFFWFSQPLCPDALPLAVGRGRRIIHLLTGMHTHAISFPRCCNAQIWPLASQRPGWVAMSEGSANSLFSLSTTCRAHSFDYFCAIIHRSFQELNNKQATNSFWVPKGSKGQQMISSCGRNYCCKLDIAVWHRYIVNPALHGAQFIGFAGTLLAS